MIHLRPARFPFHRFPAQRSCLRIVVTAASYLALLAVGCSRAPQAPALRDAPVYQNKSAGFRFLVPQGWNQSANARLPDNWEQEFLLAKYRLSTSPQGALFEVLCFAAKPDFDLAAHHAGPSHGVKAWTPLKDADPQATAGKSVERLLFSAQIADKPTVKEVVNVTRGERIFSFVGLYGSRDAAAQEEIRRAVASIQWD